jgi:MFS superfamily sulfate permease-like transporter
LAEYQPFWLLGDIVAGVPWRPTQFRFPWPTLDLQVYPPQVGVYGYLPGGLGYALLGSSRQLAIGPTSAISLMIAGTVGAMADGDAQRYAQIASLAAFTVAALCLFAWLLRLSELVKLISDSILVGFKAGAGLTIAMTQLPSLFGVAGGGHNFFDRTWMLLGQLGQIHYVILMVGVVAIGLIVLGERLLPGKPVALGVVTPAIIAATVLGLPARRSGGHPRNNAAERPQGGEKCQSRHNQRYDAVDGAAAFAVAGHQLDGRPFLPKESRRLVHIRGVYLDATRAASTLIRDLKEESVASRFAIVMDRRSFLPHSKSP